MNKIPRIAVAGSLNMDLVVSADRMPQQGETITGSSIHYLAGGKGANQAVGCARLGARVEMVGAVGNDAFGQTLLDAMLENGVGTGAVSRMKDVSTGIAAIMRADDDNSIIIVPGANGKVTPELIQANASVIAEADVLLVQLEIPLDAVKEALRIAREAGVVTILNPAPARTLPDDLLQLADYLTPNETEFATLAGYSGKDGEDEWLGRMVDWESSNRQKVVLTRGKQGATVLVEGEALTAPAPKVEVVDTTGAGDCLNAAFAYGLASGWSLERTLSFAVNAASLSVGRLGAQAGMPTLGEVEKAIG